MNEIQVLVVGLLATVAVIVTWAVTRGGRASAVFEQVDRMAAQVNELTLRVVELELDRAGYRLWTAQLRGQIVELGHTPVPPPPWLVVTGGAGMGDAGPTAESVLVMVYQRVMKHFDMEEIADLALRVGIDGEAFGGDTQPGRARELVEYAVRHGKLSELVKEARRQRPAVDWPYVAAGNGYQTHL
jgi:hypothetical protein